MAKFEKRKRDGKMSYWVDDKNIVDLPENMCNDQIEFAMISAYSRGVQWSAEEIRNAMVKTTVYITEKFE